MTGTYEHPFVSPEASSPTEHRTVVAMLGLGLLAMVLAFAWSGVAARLEPASSTRSSAAGAATRLESEGPRPMLVETGNPQWILEESSP